MSELARSESVARLIRLVLMLPSPKSEQFWEAVAQEHNHWDTRYVKGRIARDLQRLLGTGSWTADPAAGLASTCLTLFGTPGEAVLDKISYEVGGASNMPGAGQAWVTEMRKTAFDVLQQRFDQETFKERGTLWSQVPPA